LKMTTATVATAWQHHQAGDLCAAEQIYRELLEAEANRAEALQGLGALAYGRGQYEQALCWLRQAVALQPGNAVLHSNLGAAYRMAGQPAEAEACYLQALRLKPDFAEAYNNLANVLKRRGRLEEAMARYRQALLARPNYPEAHLNLALALGETGQRAEAKGHFEKAARARPDSAEVQSGWGLLLRELGQPEQAIEHLRKALQLKPQEAKHHFNLALTLQEQGKLEEAVICLQEAVHLQPSWAEAHFTLALANLRHDRWEEALVSFKQALQLRPDLPEAHYYLGHALLGQGLLAEAVAHFRQLPPAPSVVEPEAPSAEREDGRKDCYEAVRLDPERADAHLELGIALGRQGRLEEAIIALHQALRVQPNYAEAYLHLGTALREQGHLERSAAYLTQALHLRPELTEAHDQLGLTLTEQGKLDLALASYQAALRQKPDAVSTLSHLGNLFELLGQPEEGRQLLERALALDPDDCQVHTHYGTALVDQGRLEEARAYFLKALTLRPDFAPAYFALARDSKYRFSEAEITRIQELLKRDRLPLRDRINLHFALARVLDRAQHFAEAFRHCNQGNACKRQLLHLQGNTFQSAGHARFIDRLIAAFNHDYFQRVQSFGSPSPLPVFIVGMPRSGTSLVEQILASHPAVLGAGEIRNLKQFVAELPAELGSSAEYPECLQQMDRQASQRLAEHYLQGLRKLGKQKSRVTDKVPMNFHHLGLIATLWPGATLIDCRRDPRDVCWSCYFQNFREVPFACDLRKLGAYYLQYERLMAHWKKTLPVRILDVCYEELVDEPEQVSRDIVAFCGLPWHNACLHFYETHRTVRTSSNLQVRRPIYKSSVGYWKNYEAHLGPLLEALSRVGERGTLAPLMP
jgi:tetratricopeptide (TPR) repeat protein